MTLVLDTHPEPAERTPILRQVDPRLRVLAVGVFAVAVVMLESFVALGFALALAVAALIHVRLPLGRTIRQVVTVDTFMIFVLISLPFTTPGETAFTLFGFPATWEGIADGFRIALKANAIVLAMLTLVGTIGPVELGHTLARLRVPAMLVHLLLFTIRYIEVLHAEYQRLRIAMRTRGFCARTDLHTLRTFGYLIGMLLIRALDRSERIMQAMRCRGFNGAFPLLYDPTFVARRDVTFGLAVVAVLVALFALEVAGAAAV